MHRKNVIVITDGLGCPEVLTRALERLDVAAQRVSSSDYAEAVSRGGVDLAIACLGSDTLQKLPDVGERLFSDGPIALLVTLDDSQLADLRLPVRISSDFIMCDAGEDEYVTRVRTLLWPGEEAGSADFLQVDDMTVNLATYQVNIGGDPVDFTYLEYALFSFLITHPGRTYSRDALLRRVWGFEYYGGSRTVDVHVRRVRAKLGPELSERLETVRGVGYLWNM